MTGTIIVRKSQGDRVWSAKARSAPRRRGNRTHSRLQPLHLQAKFTAIYEGRVLVGRLPDFCAGSNALHVTSRLVQVFDGPLATKRDFQAAMHGE